MDWLASARCTDDVEVVARFVDDPDGGLSSMCRNMLRGAIAVARRDLLSGLTKPTTKTDLLHAPAAPV